MTYPRIENVNILEALENIMRLHTIHYQSDFVYDTEAMKEKVKDPEKEQSFLWISRTSGTNMFSERNIFIQETSSNSAFQTWFSKRNTPLLYLCELKDSNNGDMKGDLTKLNYADVLAFTQKNAVKPTHVSVLCGDSKTALVFPYQEFKQNQDMIAKEHGSFSHIKYEVEKETSLLANIAQNRANTIGKSKIMTLEAHLNEVAIHCQKIYENHESYHLLPDTDQEKIDLTGVLEDDYAR